MVPADVETLLSLPGIGAYTARAVACFAYRRPVPVVDTNVRRVFARAVTGVDTRRLPTCCVSGAKRNRRHLPGRSPSSSARAAEATSCARITWATSSWSASSAAITSPGRVPESCRREAPFELHFAVARAPRLTTMVFPVTVNDSKLRKEGSSQ